MSQFYNFHCDDQDMERGLPLMPCESQVLDHSTIVHVIPHNMTSEVGVLTACLDPSYPTPNMCIDTDRKVAEPIENQQKNSISYSPNQPIVEYSPQEETLTEETIQECQQIIYTPTTTFTEEVFKSKMSCEHPHVAFPTSAMSTALPVPSHLYYLKCPSLSAHKV